MFGPCLVRTYVALAASAADADAQQAYARKALDAAEAFDGLGGGVYRSLLFRGLAYSPAKFTKTEMLSQRELALRELAGSGILPGE